MIPSSTTEFVPFRPPPKSRATPIPNPLPIVQESPSFPAFSPLSLPHPAACAATPPSNHSPIVTLRREGERVTGIRIQCSCGQILDLTCEF
jgi:hypothetical protein